MGSDSRFGYGARMNRPQQQSQFVSMTPVVHSTLAYPRTGAASGASSLDLTSAIAHELGRVNEQPGWLATPGLYHEAATMPYGAFQPPQQQLIPQYIPRFDEGLQGPPRFDHSYSESESYASAQQEFYSRSSSGQLGSLHPTHQAFQAATSRGSDSGRSCSPWIERMLQSDVTPTPCPSGPSQLGGTRCLQQTSSEQTAVSCVLSQPVDVQQSCHSNDLQQRSSEKSMRSAFSSDGPHAHESSALESFSADLCTDDDDLETRPMDVKRKKRMLSNRASAQRSRQRRQERLDQLEVLTAQLRVENSTLQKKLSGAIQLAKKYEDLSKNLAKQVERLSKELQADDGDVKTSAHLGECASSPQTTGASSCEMVGEQVSASSPPRPSAKSPRKRSYEQLENHMESRSLGCMASMRPTRPTSPTAFLEPATIRPFSHIVNEASLNPGLKAVDDSNLDCLDSDRWFEFADCFM